MAAKCGLGDLESQKFKILVAMVTYLCDLENLISWYFRQKCITAKYDYNIRIHPSDIGLRTCSRNQPLLNIDKGQYLQYLKSRCNFTDDVIVTKIVLFYNRKCQDYVYIKWEYWSTM